VGGAAPTDLHPPAERDPGPIDELVRVPDQKTFELRRGARARVLCWGILRPSGRSRHPVFVGWGQATEADRPHRV